MARKLTTDDLVEGIQALEATSRQQAITDVLTDLEDFFKQGPIEGDEDTWESGYRAAIETIRSNYS